MQHAGLHLRLIGRRLIASLLLMAFVNLLLLPSAFASPVPPVLQEATTDDTSDTDPPITETDTEDPSDTDPPATESDTEDPSDTDPPVTETDTEDPSDTDPPMLMTIGINSTELLPKVAKVNGAKLILCFEESLAYPDQSLADAFTVTYGAEATKIKATDIYWEFCTSDRDDPWFYTLQIELASAVPYGAPVLVSYEKPSAGSVLRTGTEVEVSSFDVEVENLTGASPVLATMDVDTLTLTYSIDLDADPASLPDDFTLTNRIPKTTVTRWSGKPKEVIVRDNLVILTFPSRLVAGEEVVLDYSPGTNPMKDADGLPVADLVKHSVKNATEPSSDTKAPDFLSGDLNRDTIVLTFNKELNADIAVRPGAFQVRRQPSHELLTINQVVIFDKTVTIRLATAVDEGEKVTLTYLLGATGGYLLQDPSGNDVPQISSYELNNETDVTPPKLLSAVVNLTTLTLTYDEKTKLDPASVPAPNDFTVTMDDTTIGVDGVSLADKAVILTLSSPVIDKASVTLVYTAGGDPLQDTSGNVVASTDPDHPVEVINNTDTTAPDLIDAVVSGATLILTYDEAMVEADHPDAADYKVTVNGSQVTVTSVTLKGAVVTLTLDTPVTKGATVKVFYTPRGTPLHDAAGNEVKDLVSHAVDNRTGAELHVGPGQPFATLESAVAVALEGNTIIVHEDEYTLSDALEVTQPNLTIRADAGTVAPTVKVQNLVGIVIDAPNVTIQGLHLIGGGTSIEINNGAAGATVQGNIFDGDDSYEGIYVNSGFTGALFIIGNELQGYEYGIYVESVTNATVTIADNKVTNSDYIGVYLGEIEDGAQVIVADNLIADNGDDPDDGAGLYLGSGAQGVMVVHNQFAGNTGPAIDVYGQNHEILANTFEAGAADSPAVVVRSDATVKRIAYNQFLGGGVGIHNASDSNSEESIDATLNWWGAASGPGESPASQVIGEGISFSPWISGLTWSPASLSMTQGTSQRPTAFFVTLNSENAEDSEPVNFSLWPLSSTDPNVASVSTDGTVLGVKAGTVTIRTELVFDLEPHLTVTVKSTSSGGDPTPTPAPPVPTEEPVVIAPDKPLQITRGSLTISIPAGAVTDRYRLTVVPPTDTTAVDQVAQVASVANATELDAVSETGNQSLHTFDEKLTLTFHYDPAQFPDPSRLAIYWYDPIMKAWVSLGGVVDPVAGTITVTVDHFTLFAVLAPHEQAPTMDAVPATTDQPTLTVTGTAAAGSTVTLVLGGKPVNSAVANELGAYSMTATLAEGRNLLYVKGTGLIASNEAVVIYTPAQQPQTGDQTGETQPGETQPGDQSGGDSQVTTPKLTDIAGHWAEPAITRLVSQGIVSGFEDQTYRPDLDISRAEFTTLLARALELKGAADLSRFTDADAIPSWARASVAAAVATSIVNGHADGSFAPEAKITRAEAAVMLANALKYKGITATGDPLTLSDGAAIPDWAKASVQAAVNSRLIIGYADGTFRPDALTTRAEVAMMLTRLLDAR